MSAGRGLVWGLGAVVVVAGCRSEREDLPRGRERAPEVISGSYAPMMAEEPPLMGAVPLAELLVRAEQRSSRVQAESWRVEQALAQRNELVAAGFLPTVTASWQVQTRSNTPRAQNIFNGVRTTFKTGEPTVRTVNVLLNQPILTISNQYARFSAADALADASAFQQLRTRQDVRRALLAAAFDLLALQEQKRSVEALIRSLQTREAEAQFLVDAGNAIKNSVLQVRVERVNQEQILFEINSAIAATQSLICALSGSPESLDFTIIWERDVPADAQAPRAEDAYEVARTSRPDLAILERQQRAAEDRSTAEWLDYVPRLDFQAGYQYNDQRQLVEDDFFTAALVASVDLIDFSRHARIKQNRAQARALESDRRELDRQVQAQVRQACLAVANELSRLRLARIAEEAARENLRVQRDRFRTGRLTANDVLDAEADLTTQEFQIIRARSQYHRALAELDFAVGRDGYAFQE